MSIEYEKEMLTLKYKGQGKPWSINFNKTHIF
jgi:hypothetical protein